MAQIRLLLSLVAFVFIVATTLAKRQPVPLPKVPECLSTLQCPVKTPPGKPMRDFCTKSNSVGYNRIVTLTQQDAAYLQTVFGETTPIAINVDGAINGQAWVSGSVGGKLNMPAIMGTYEANSGVLAKLFIREFNVSDILSVEVMTKPNHPTQNFHMNIYTQFKGVSSAGSWYHDRITVLLENAYNLDLQPNEWNLFSTAPGKNQMRLFDGARLAACSNANTAISLDNIRFQTDLNLSGQFCWDGSGGVCCHDYDDSPVRYITFETASNIEPGFNGAIDGVKVCLKGNYAWEKECLTLDLQRDQVYSQKEMIQCECKLGFQNFKCQTPLHPQQCQCLEGGVACGKCWTEK